jgi:hypothetical protein
VTKFAIIFANPRVRDTDVLTVKFDERAIFNSANFLHIGPLVYVPIPKALMPFLQGKSTLSIEDVSKDKEVAYAEVIFGKKSDTSVINGERVLIEDADGRPLAVNKWGRLGHATALDDKVRPTLISKTKEILDELTKIGYKVAISSATLLAAVRNKGKMLDSDDDSDLLVFSDSELPQDAYLLMLKLKRDLEKRGHTVIRFSGAHIQALFFAENGSIDFYIDFFVGFFKDGYYNQPFALRKKMPKESIYPFKQIYWEGDFVPAPAVPEDWLAACYGEDWRTPNPAFRFNNPVLTTYLFNQWFGNSMNDVRDFWEAEATSSVEFLKHVFDSETHTHLVKKYIKSGVPILDIGFGNGEFSADLVEQNHPVLAIDYSAVAVQKAKIKFADKKLKRELVFKYINLHDDNALIELLTDIEADEREWSVNISHGLHLFMGSARRQIYYSLSKILKPKNITQKPAKSTQSQINTGLPLAVISFDTETDVNMLDIDDPNTWWLGKNTFFDEIDDYPLEVIAERKGEKVLSNGRTRDFITVVVKYAEKGKER